MLLGFGWPSVALSVPLDDLLHGVAQAKFAGQVDEVKLGFGVNFAVQVDALAFAFAIAVSHATPAR